MVQGVYQWAGKEAGRRPACLAAKKQPPDPEVDRAVVDGG